MPEALEGPLLWYLNRGTGIVAIVLLTVTTVLGVLAIGGRPAGRVPRFVTQAVHRNVALLSVLLLVAHVVSAVLDEFVEIRWWEAFVPFGAEYEPFHVGLGAAAVDLTAVVVVTSLLRHRMRHRGWRVLHLSAYALWGAAMWHGIGVGSDMDSALKPLTIVCLAAVPTALVWRLGVLLVQSVRRALAFRRTRRQAAGQPRAALDRSPRGELATALRRS